MRIGGSPTDALNQSSGLLAVADLRIMRIEALVCACEAPGRASFCATLTSQAKVPPTGLARSNAVGTKVRRTSLRVATLLLRPISRAGLSTIQRLRHWAGSSLNASTTS